jgi:hypothetical protein
MTLAGVVNTIVHAIPAVGLAIGQVEIFRTIERERTAMKLLRAIHVGVE